ncbi:MAG: MmcQ/YjbR family DNA-binding protein [Anaerolineae bacterium]|nr:MmcQ/YjbR family DNA-binding protein [Anaerolineae bacterium]
MTRNQLRDRCLGHPGAIEDFPFGDDVAVYKVGGKMFALLPFAKPPTISLKCEPTLAKILRDTYPGVQPGYHLNKRHWNTVTVDGSIPSDEIVDMIEHSYARVFDGLTRAQRKAIRDEG